MVNAMPLESTLVASWWSSLRKISRQLETLSVASGRQLSRVMGGQHVIGVCDLALLITNNWEAQLAAGDLIDILDPASVRLDGVGRETDQLDATLGEFRLELCEGAELGGADRCVVLRVGEENNPFVANELVKVDGTLSGLGFEVGGSGTQADTRDNDLLVCSTTKIEERSQLEEPCAQGKQQLLGPFRAIREP